MSNLVAESLPGGFMGLIAAPLSTRNRGLAIVWLHGIGERGTDLSLVLKFGLPAAIAERRLQTNATVLCPQLEADVEWEPSRIGTLMTYVRERYEHAALIGFSLGALGVAETLAELGPQCEQHIALAPRMRRLPLVSQVGTRLLSVAGEHDIWPAAASYLRAIRDLGGQAEEAILPNEGHFISEAGLWHAKAQSALRSLGIELRAAYEA